MGRTFLYCVARAIKAVLFKAQAIDQLRAGVPLSGKDAAEKALDDLETK